MLPSEVVTGLDCCSGGRCERAAGEEARTLSKWHRAEPSRYLRWPLASVLETSACPAAVRCARRHARQVLGEWRLPGALVEDAELLAAELMSNAVAATLAIGQAEPVALRLLANRERLVIEAWDCHPGVPVPRTADEDDESGRGLAIVAEVAHRWGTRRLSAHVKAVWAELPLLARHSGNSGEGKAHA